MPSLSEDLIQGSDRASDIETKVMDCVDALWAMLQHDTTSVPSSGTVTAEHALCEYVADAASNDRFASIRVAGEDYQNGIRIKDVNGGVGTNGTEFRIMVKHDWQGDGGTARPALVVQKRTTTGDFSETTYTVSVAAGWQDILAIDANTVWHTDDDIDDLADKLADFARRIGDLEDLIGGGGGSGGISIGSVSGGGVLVTDTSGGGTAYTVEIDTNNSLGTGTAQAGDALSFDGANVVWAAPSLQYFYSAYTNVSNQSIATQYQIPFANTIINYGGFNNSSGHIDVPVSGYYLINVAGSMSTASEAGYALFTLHAEAATYSIIVPSPSTSVPHGTFSYSVIYYLNSTGSPDVEATISNGSGITSNLTNLRVYLTLALLA